MKKVILLVAVILSSLTVSAQFEVKEGVKEVTVWSSLKQTGLSRTVSDEGVKSYNLSFRNLEYKAIEDIQSISFSNEAELIQFFELCRKAYADKSKGVLRTPIYSLKKSILKQVEVKNERGAYFYLLLRDVTKMESKL